MAEIKSSKSDKLLQGSALGLGAVLALALFVMVNYLALRHYKRFDWTSSKIYSLSEKTKNVLADIDRPIDLVSVLDPGSQLYPAVDELLSRYEAANPQLIKKRALDKARNQLEAQQLFSRYKIDRANVIVIASGDDRRVIDELDLADYDYSGAQFGQAPTMQGFKGEQMITSAILELVEERKPKILLTTGHGEAGIGAGSERSLSRARDLLGQDNFDVEEWGSLGKTEVPPGTDLVIVAGPQSAFLSPELEVFSHYLEAGGRMLFLLDPVLDAKSLSPDYGLGAWLGGYGIEIRDDLVIDPANTLPFFGAETVFTSDFGFHPIVESLAQLEQTVLLPLARSVRKAATVSAEKDVSELVTTSSEGWGETDLAALPKVEKGNDDIPGPVSLGVAVSFKIGPEPPAGKVPGHEDDSLDEDNLEDHASEQKPDDRPEARLVVFGDLDFATDTQIASGSNAALLLNTLNWLAERKQLLAIEARRPEQTKLLLGSAELSSIYLLVLLILPGAAVAVGTMTYLRRRR
ncbi:MAG: GldG family protein [Thermoanaerobaculia bacterium]|nr:GldG family protein [Thermoanaerobaculia bacterium]